MLTGLAMPPHHFLFKSNFKSSEEKTSKFKFSIIKNLIFMKPEPRTLYTISLEAANNDEPACSKKWSYIL